MGVTLCEGTPQPLVYWTLIPGTMTRGPAERSIRTAESKKLVQSFRETTRSSNKISVGTTASVSGVFKAFSASAEVTAGYEHFTETSTSSETTVEISMAKQIHTTMTIKSGSWGLVVAEMKMFAYRTKSGKRESLVIPTGNIFTGSMDKEALDNHYLDDSFSSPATEYGLNVYTRQQLLGLVTSYNVPLVEDICSTGWTNFKDSCYKFMPEKLTWHYAKKSCENQVPKSNLVSIQGPTENSEVATIAKDNFWTGGYKNSYGTWKWAGDESNIYWLHWRRTQPNNCLYWGRDFICENRIAVTIAAGPRDSGKWDDFREDGKFAHVCEYRIGEECAAGWTQYKESCYKFMTKKVSYFYSQKLCKREHAGAHTVSIQDVEENRFVSSLSNYQQFWTGGRKTGGTWKWCNYSYNYLQYSCENVHYTSWSRNQPDNFRGQQKYIVGNFGREKWDDDKWWAKFKFICEYKMEL